MEPFELLGLWRACGFGCRERRGYVQVSGFGPRASGLGVGGLGFRDLEFRV